MQQYLGSDQLSAILEFEPDVPNKGIAHICWAESIIKKSSQNVPLILRFKRIPFKDLSDSDRVIAARAICTLEHFAASYSPPPTFLTFREKLEKYLEEESVYD